MKLKKIESICKNGACIRINRAPDKKIWIGDESAVYFVGGIPDITKEQLLAIFDIPEDKREGYSVVESDSYIDDIDSGERMINRRLKTELCIGSRRYIIYEADGRLICINSKYLNPLNDEKECTLFLRNSGRHIAIKKGMFIIALICTFDIVSVDDIGEDIEFINSAFN